MVSLRPKEGGGVLPPGPPAQGGKLIPLVLAIAVVAIAVVAYRQYTAKTALEGRIATLEQQIIENFKQVRANANDLAADLDVVTKKLGVTTQDLEASRKYAEKLRADQERAK